MLPIKLKPSVMSKVEDDKLLKKMKKAEKPKKRKSKSIIDFIESIRQDLSTHLGQYESKFRLIRDYDTLVEYIKGANRVGKIAIDTETTGLNPLVDNIVGLCLYYPGQKATYVPINHVDYITRERLNDQCTAEEVRKALELLDAKIIMHNAQFDIRILKNCVGIKLECWWDTQLGAALIDENENHKLKYLHGKYISHTKEKSFKDYFDDVRFTNIPIEYAYLYAANDAIDTYELYEYQTQFLNDTSGDPVTDNMYWLFRNIEIAMIDVIVELEDNGVTVDREYLDSLHEKYHKLLDEAKQACYETIIPLQDKIDKYKQSNVSCKLAEPINLNSGTQLAILFYDILKAKPLEGKKARCVDGDVMESWSDEFPTAKALVDYRAFQKMVSTYIDNIPNIILKDGRVHTHFNSMGAKTGRMSSSKPLNLQNIPSHNEDIRKMFVGQTTNRDVEKRSDNAYILKREEEVQLEDGTWVWAESVKPGDILESGETVKAVRVKDFKVLIGV